MTAQTDTRESSPGRAGPPKGVKVPGRRLVVIDSETSGLFGDVRVLSLAAVELRNGITGVARSWMFNPGKFFMDPSALAVNGLGSEELADAPNFADCIDEIVAWLTPKKGERLTLIGHKISFDLTHLRTEFERLNMRLPDADVLDTGVLASAASVVPASSSLQSMLDALGLANTAPHAALADTLATSVAALELLNRLAQKVGKAKVASVIDDLCKPIDAPEAAGESVVIDEDEGLSDAHRAAHLADLSDGRTRNRHLEVCLREDCVIIHRRMEDGMMTNAHARQIIDWAFAHLLASQDASQSASKKLSRAMEGRLLRGVGQALRRVEDPVWVEKFYLTRLVPYLSNTKPCTPKRRRCDRCAKNRLCDLDSVVRRCVDGYLHDEFTPFVGPTIKQANRFLPGYDPKVKRGRGRPLEGFYGKLKRHGHLDAAGYGLALIAQVRRVTGSREWAYKLVRKGWQDGCRTPQMVETLASMTVVDGIAEPDEDGTMDPRAPIRDALGYIDECRRVHPNQQGAVFDRLAKRRERLETIAANPPRPPRDMDKAINRRALPTSTIGRQPEALPPVRRQRRVVQVPTLYPPAPPKSAPRTRKPAVKRRPSAK